MPRNAPSGLSLPPSSTYNARSCIKRAYNSVMTKGERVIAISAFIAEHVHRFYGVPASRLELFTRASISTVSILLKSRPNGSCSWLTGD